MFIIAAMSSWATYTDFGRVVHLLRLDGFALYVHVENVEQASLINQINQFHDKNQLYRSIDGLLWNKELNIST